MELDIKRLAKLAKLKFTPEEEEKYAAQMANIVAMVEKTPRPRRPRPADRPR